MRGKITKRSVEALKPAADRDVFLWDTGDGALKGFGVKVTPSGRKVYLVQYRAGAGGRGSPVRRYTIGVHGPWTAEAARDAAGEILHQVKNGQDPQADKAAERRAETLAAFAERYLAEHAETKKKPTSVRMDKINLQRHVLPALGRRKLSDIERADVARLHHAMRATPGAANRVYALMHKMFDLAEKWGLRPDGSNPCRDIEKYPEKRRERFLSSDEIRVLGDTLSKAEREGAVSIFFAALVRLLILTGARLGEIQTARWEWVDFERACLKLPDSKTGLKEVHLPAPALKLLQALPRVDGNPHVIRGAKAGDFLRNPWKPWNLIRKRAGLGDVRIHDLRHSFASVGAGAGLGLPIIGKILGHRQATTTARYAHVAPDPTRQAAETIAATIHAAMTGKSKTGRVVPLKRPRRNS
jgi:integrase